VVCGLRFIFAPIIRAERNDEW